MTADTTQATSEARAAARWWTEQLDTLSSDTGDALNDSLLTSARTAAARPVTDEQRAAFEAALLAAIERDIVASGTWARAVNRQDPSWGSALRTIEVDYAPGPLLSEALAAAGIRGGMLTPLPNKTIMTVSPGEVLVTRGYGAPWRAVWRRESRGSHDSPNDRPQPAGDQPETAQP